MNELTKEYFDKTIHELKKDVQTEIGTLRTEVGVLFENADDKLGLILEGQSGIRDDIRTIKGSVKNLSDCVTKTEIRLDVIEAR